MKKLTDAERIELIIDTLELKMKKAALEVEINERDDAEQLMKMFIMDKTPVLMKEEAPGFIDFCAFKKRNC